MTSVMTVLKNYRLQTILKYNASTTEKKYSYSERKDTKHSIMFYLTDNIKIEI